MDADGDRDVVVVSDTSVLIDLERGCLLEAAFRQPFAFAVPDLLYEQELKAREGSRLRELGLQIAQLDGDGVAKAVEYRKQVPALSLPDCFALALAVRGNWTLLTGDAKLRRLAEASRVECHGLLWLLDEMLAAGAATSRTLHDGLRAVSEHPRCRLPKAEVRDRLDLFARSPELQCGAHDCALTRTLGGTREPAIGRRRGLRLTE